MQVKRKNEKPVEMRAAPATYIIFGSMIGVFLLLGLLASSRNPSSWKIVLVLFLVAAFVMAWISSLKITLTDTSISYRTLFGGTKTLLFSEIEQAGYKIGYESSSEKFEPPLRLVIQPHEEAGKRPIKINVKALRLKDVVRLTKVLEEQTSYKSSVTKL